MTASRIRTNNLRVYQNFYIAGRNVLQLTFAHEFHKKTHSQTKLTPRCAAKLELAPAFSMDGRALRCVASSYDDTREGSSAGELEQGLIVTLDHVEGGAALAKTKSRPPGLRDDTCGNADDFVHHGTQMPPLGRMVNRAVQVDQGRL